MRTSINIKNKDHSCTYLIDYIRGGEKSGDLFQIESSDAVILNDTILQKARIQNRWVDLSSVQKNTFNMEYKTSQVIVYFPKFSVDTYNPKTLYSFNAETWIHGKHIILGSWIINRLDALASDKLVKFNGEEYDECIKLEIIDPFSLIYEDSWSNFREFVCGENYEGGYTLNNTGSVLYFSLIPVEEVNGEMIITGDWIGGQNSINISNEDTDDYLNLKITTNIDRDLCEREPSINLNLGFNSDYNGDLRMYMKETYNVDDYLLKYSLVIGTEEDIYYVGESNIIHSRNQTSFSFSKTNIREDGNFSSWEGWVPGINLVGSLDILSLDGESIMYILSQPLPLTQNLYKFFVGDDWIVAGKPVRGVNLNLVDMNVYNINAVNKIEQNVVQVNHAGDFNNRTNIIQPVFFRSVDSANIVVQPAVTETIAINLDAYKSKVKSFKLRIEDVTFIEIGRVASGVLFKIVGNKLPRINQSGRYYILNETGELVTSGDYKYIS